MHYKICIAAFKIEGILIETDEQLNLTIMQFDKLNYLLYEVRYAYDNMRAWIVLLFDTRVGNFGMQTILSYHVTRTIYMCYTFGGSRSFRIRQILLS